MTKTYRFQHLFQKYLSNDCSEQELHELVQMLQDMDDDELDPQLKTLWGRSKNTELTQSVDWQSMLDEIMRSEDSLINIRENKKNNTRHFWINVATAAIIIVAFSVGINYYLRDYNNDTAMAYTERKIPVKEIEEILLADGSKITLNAGSTLRYPERFNGKTREVYLEGEAIFDVAHDPGKPFIVHAAQLKTTVLGTKFNISAYPGAEKIEVTVLHGKVSVQETISQKTATLLPSQRAVYNTKTEQFISAEIANVERETDWQKGRTAFDDASLADVAAQFYRQYGIQVTLESPALANCRISIVFNDDNVDNLLKTITSLTNSNYRYHEKSVILHGDGCERTLPNQ